MRPVAYNDRALFIGQTQSGKSTIARFIWGRMTGARRVCIDVKGQCDVGVPPVFDVASIDWTAPVVRFIPRSMDQRLYDELYAAVLEHGGPTTIWLDEGFGPTSGNRAPDSMLVVQQQGAALGIGHIVCSQRPLNIAVPLRTEAEHIFIVVPPISFDDLAVLAREIAEIDGRPAGARELRELLREVQGTHGPHSFVWWQRATGELNVFEPLDPGLAHAPVATGRPGAAPGPPSSADREGAVEIAEDGNPAQP